MKLPLNAALASWLAAFAAASSSAADRVWSASNCARAPFNAVSSWNPAPASMSDVGGDRMILDKGLDAVAVFSAGDDVKVDRLDVGAHASGGSFEMSGGTLNLSRVCIGNGAGSAGNATLAGPDANLRASYAIFVGDTGSGELTIDGGMVWSQFAVQLGSGGCSGNTAVVNLNGGVLETAQVNAHGAPVATFNWNGGTLKHSGNNFDGGIFPADEKIALNVLAGGAFYESDRNESFNHPLAGDGAFVCRVNSGKTLTLAGAADLKGGFRVESGSLRVASLVRTKFRELAVASGASLDLNGASVTVAHYRLNGVDQPTGIYSEHNGTIVVDRRPDVLAKAAAWYDPSDTDAVTVVDGKVTAIKNKGTVGSALDLGLRSTSKGGATVVADAFNGRQSLAFNSASGYRSNGYFPDDLPASGPRTLFAVVQGTSVGFLSVAQTGGDEEGRSLLLASDSFGKGYQVGELRGSNWEKTRSGVAYSYDSPCVIFGRTKPGDGGYASVTAGILDEYGNTNGETKNIYMPADKTGLRFKAYYGTFDIAYGYNSDTAGWQGEALVFTNALSDAEMADVGAYLKAKWIDAGGGADDDVFDLDEYTVDGEVDLGGRVWKIGRLSGDGFLTNGTVIVTGELEVTVGRTWSVDVPTFDRLVLGPDARLVVKGAANLPRDRSINILPFTSLSGRFASVSGDWGVPVLAIYEEDHICAQCGRIGTRVILR